MNTCKTCKWWAKRQDEESNIFPPGMAECRCPMISTEERPGKLVAYNIYTYKGVEYLDEAALKMLCGTKEEWAANVGYRNAVRVNRPDMARAAAGDYYPAEFRTGPEFGCVHHKEKTP